MYELIYLARMGNKRKILDVARELFNASGLKNVTARVICTQLKISPGSFSYHFPDKSLIVQTLYEEMREEGQGVIDEMSQKEVSVISYLETHRHLFLIQEKYRFFYLNLFEIVTNYPEIGRLHRESTLMERGMAKQMIQYYISSGVIRGDLKEEQIDRMINVGQILNNFWAVDAELMPKMKKKEKQVYYMKICCGLLEPYLEPESLEAYHDYFENL